MKKIIITTAVIFFSMAGIADAAPDSNSIIRNGIEYYIQTDKSVYYLGENVQMLYRVTNLGVEDVVFTFNCGPIDDRCNYIVEKDGERIWDNLGRSVTWAITQFTLSPLESYEYTKIWNMTYKNGDEIVPGNYDVTAVLDYAPSYERYVPVSVLIEIIPQPATTYYVNATEGSDNNDGLSPQTAFATIQAAIDAADDYDTVLVADGTYTGPGNRDIDFLGKAITVRSESGPENCIIDCNGSRDEPHRGFYFYRNEHTNSILSGFTITNGYTTSQGAGICCGNSSPTINNCIITGSLAEDSWNAWGGGIACYLSNAMITNCTITNNRAGGYSGKGGAISCVDSSPTIINCIVKDNTARLGGGIYCDQSSPTITNCIINGNSTEPPLAEGGGIYLTDTSGTITNCTIVDNTSSGIYGGGIMCHESNPTITNCIIRRNSPQQFKDWSNTVLITYSNVEGGWEGEGNIAVDPGFAFLHDLHLIPGSLCIDAGTSDPCGGLPATDKDGVPRPLDGDGDGNAVADMGAYEYTPDSPSIAVSAVSFYFVQDWPKPDPQTLLIRNYGGRTLNWEIVEDCNWLQVAPPNGVSTNQINEVTITVNPNGLARGLYSYDFKVQDPNASNSPVTVRVTMPVGILLRIPSPDYPTIQAAIDAAVDYDIVLVADGTYTGPGNRDIDFLGKAITVRSENGPENCVIDCNATESEFHRGFNFHNGEQANSKLDSFTITNGYETEGGGIYCSSSSPTITNCTIVGNSTTKDGAGINLYERSDPIISNCTISENSAYLYGGGIFCHYGSNPLIINCTISKNTSSSGPSVYCSYSGPTITHCFITDNWSTDGPGGIVGCRGPITNCVISNNRSKNYGAGGLYSCSGPISNCIISGNSTPTDGGAISYCYGPITNCIIVGNSAGRNGGAIYLYRRNESAGDSLRLTNCTIAGNSAGNGNALACDSALQNYPSNVELTNCILADGGDEIWNNDESNIAITYSNIQGGWPGEGNIDADPCFVFPGYWADANDPNIIVEPNDPNAVWIDGDYHLLRTSPCVDAGTDANVYTDIEGNVRPFDFPGVDNNGELPEFDMGAYELVPVEAAMKLTPQALNCNSKGKYVKAHFVLPEGFSPEDVDVNAPAIAEPMGAYSEYIRVFSNNEGPVKLEIIFDREAFCETITETGEVEITVIGSLTTGQYFSGTDTIKIKPQH